MQNIELYIEGQRVELFKDESVSLTQSIKNAKQVDKIFTEFTKTFTVPASKSNNKIFKHYYNFDIDNGFDARIKKPATIELNSYPFKEGKIKLEGVSLKDNKPYAYRITFFGNTVNLKDIVGEDKLNVLTNLDALSETYSSSEIKLALQRDPATSDVLVPLITHTDRLYFETSNNSVDDGNLWYQSGHQHGVLFSQLKYALRIRKIVEAIETQYTGITFSSDFFTSTNLPYNNLFMWLHRKKGAVESGSGSQYVNTINGWSVATENKSEMVNSTTFKITNTDDVISLLLNFDTGILSYSFIVIVKRDGQVVFTNTINSTGGNNLVNLTPYINLNSEYTVTLNYDTPTLIFSGITWTYLYSTSGSPDSFNTGFYGAPPAFEFNITSQAPDIKIIDFLTGIFKMFNLVAYVNAAGTIVVETLDSFYENGINYDISNFIDINDSQVDVALPYKEIVFGYKDTKTLLAAVHNQLFNYEWSKEAYNGGESLDGGIYKVELPFAHFKFERLLDLDDSSLTDVQWGYSVDDNRESYIGDPFLFYPIRQTSATEISFRDSTTLHSPITTYIIPSNSLDLDSTVSKDNINFKNENNEYEGGTEFTDTLFQKYYSNYITDVFNSKNRLTKVTAYLPLRILLNLKLSDRLDINGRRYKINSIKTNLQDGKSELELLNEYPVETFNVETETGDRLIAENSDKIILE